jgi:outer membrane protein assembly factor BamA
VPCFYKLWKKVLVLFLVSGLLTASTGLAQQKLQVQIVPVDSVAKQYLIKNDLQIRASDSLSILKKLKAFNNNFINKGYLASNFDSIIFDTTSVKAFFYLGHKYSFEKLKIRGIPENILRELRLTKKIAKGKAISYSDFILLRKKTIEYYENNGYPFASVLIDSISVDNEGLHGNLMVKQNVFVKIDSIVVKGKPKIARKYLNHYLPVKKGEAYNQKKINDLSSWVDELPYIQVFKPAEVEFRDAKAAIYLYLKNKPANYFNGIIGFASGTEENPDFQITGDLSLKLVNAFKIGEELSIYWDKYSANSQNLKLGFQFPYLFFLPIGIDFRFGLEKHELDYLNTDLFGAVAYSFSAKNLLKVYFAQKNSYLINNEEETSLNIEEASRFTLGMTFLLDNTDYRLNPRKGFFVEASSGYGTRSVLDINSSLIDFELQLEYYLKLGRMGTLALLNQSAGVFSDVGFYENELFKIGGINSLRGFDEQSVFASTYSIFSIEPRLLIGKNSAVYLFADLAWYEAKLVGSQYDDTPFGAGLGINIDTKAGIFKLNYAVGKQFDNPVKFSDSKMHFGFTARF